MKDTKFFEQALELVAPWKVVDVNMDVAAKKVEVKVDCGSDQMWLDPQSGKRLHIHGYEQRRWRHLPTMQFETIIVAQVPRLKYPDGHTELVKVVARYGSSALSGVEHLRLLVGRDSAVDTLLGTSDR